MDTIVYDGQCPVCTALKEVADEKVDRDQIRFKPYQSDSLKALAPDLTESELSQSLYVIGENGERVRGARAVFEVLSQFPGLWGVVGKILKLPPFYWVAEPFYRLFARHRHRVRIKT